MNTVKKIRAEIERLQNDLVNKIQGPQGKEEIMEQIQELEWDIDDILEAEGDQQRWEDETGNTPQDRYLEQNHYAIVQSERYEQFRREY